MESETFVLGELQTNCYLLSNPHNGEALLIDPAAEGDWLNEELLRRHLELKAVLLTHGHFDHVLALLSLKLAWQMPIYCQEQDWFLLKEAANSAQYWLQHPVDPIPPADLSLADGEKLELAGSLIEVITTPGHTPGSVGFLLAKEKLYFSGDTWFKDGVGSTRHRYSSQAQLLHSLQKIQALVKKGRVAEVLPGHGASFFP